MRPRGWRRAARAVRDSIALGGALLSGACRGAPDAPTGAATPPHALGRSLSPPAGPAAVRAAAAAMPVAAGGRAAVDATGRLVVDGRTVAADVLPGLTVGPDGSVAYARAEQPPASDVWRVRPGRLPERVTRDGRSERPFYLPDGRLLWTSSAGSGRVGWFLEGRRLNSFPAAPVPAYPDRTRFEGGRVVFHAGDAWYALEPATGKTEPWP